MVLIRLKSLIGLIRARPNVAVFAVGAALFAGGLAMVIQAQLRPPVGSRAIIEPSPSPAAKPYRVGPQQGEPVAPYLARKRTLLNERATGQPREPVYGLMVFNSYRKASEVEALIGARQLEVHSVHVRVPLPTFKPREIVVEGRSFAEAIGEERSRVARDLEALERVVAEATDPNFRNVYQQELRLHREALGHLGDDPGIVFAIVVRGTNASLRSTASAANIRYVELPDDPVATPEDTVYAPLIPEDTSTATFALQ